VFTRGSLFTPAPVYDKVCHVCFKPSKRKEGGCGVKCAKNKWKGASWLAVAGGLMLLTACHASAQEAGRYQWTMAPRDGSEGSPIVPYIFDSVTGDIARWEPPRENYFPHGIEYSTGRWVSAMKTPPVDWDDIRKQREAAEARESARIKEIEERQEAEKKRQAELQAKCDAFLDTVPRKSPEELMAGLEELVASAESIVVLAFMGTRAGRLPSGLVPPEDYAFVEQLKGKQGDRSYSSFGKTRMNEETIGRLEKKKGDIFVQFTQKLEEDVYVQFYLSSAAFDNKTVFPAPATIVENIKAILPKEKGGD
jgi:hypothetical protein